MVKKFYVSDDTRSAGFCGSQVNPLFVVSTVFSGKSEKKINLSNKRSRIKWKDSNKLLSNNINKIKLTDKTTFPCFFCCETSTGLLYYLSRAVSLTSEFAREYLCRQYQKNHVRSPK